MEISEPYLLLLLLLQLVLPGAHGGADAGPGDPDFR